MSDQPSKEHFLQCVLVARAHHLRTYVAERIPPYLATVIVPDDVLQEVWIAAFRSVGTLRIEDPAAVDHWILSITNRKLLDAIKQAHAVKRGGGRAQVAQERSSSVPSMLERLMAAGKTPSREVSVKEASSAIHNALSRLSDDRQRAIKMRFVEGLKLKEIAERMGKSPNAISALLFNGLREMRARLGHARKFFSDARSQDAPAPDPAVAESAHENAKAAAS